MSDPTAGITPARLRVSRAGAVGISALALALLVGTGTPVQASVVANAPDPGPIRVVTVTNVNGRPTITTTTTSGRRAAQAAVSAARRSPATVSVSVDHVLRIVGASDQSFPQSNDADRPDQWALTRLRAEQTWASTTGSGVTVAVVDTGVEGDHPDLAGTVLTGIDLVGDGSASDGSGAQAGSASQPGWDDENGHGTHVAGIVAAVAGNGIGIAGMAPGVKILPVRVLDGAGAGFDSVIARGIVQAVDRGANVINLSMGGVEAGATSSAVRYALSKNVVVVAAAGNERKVGNTISYPAADAGVIGVAATNSRDTDASFSNTGSYVDLAAPGVRIWSTYKGKGYKVMDGTSMATAFVAATAAMLKAISPALTPAAVAGLLERSATDLGKAGRDDATGYGLVNPYTAVCTLTACNGAAEPVATRIALSGGTPPGALPFGTKATVTARVVTAASGQALVNVPAEVCVRAVPATTDRCATLTTDATGTVRYILTLQGQTSVSVRYLGSTTTGPSQSTVALYRVSPRVTPRGGRRQVSADVTPGVGRIVLLDRWNGRGWSAVRTVRATAVARGSTVGRANFTRLPVGSYRVRTAATAALIATISATVRAN